MRTIMSPFEYGILCMNVLDELARVEHPGVEVGELALAAYFRLCEARTAVVAAVVRAEAQQVHSEVEALLT